MSNTNERKKERELFDQHYNMVYQLAFYMVKDEDLASDIVQDAFIKVFRHLHTLENQEKMEAWIKTITRRTALDYLRKQKRWNENNVEEVYLEKGEDTKDSIIETNFAEKEMEEEILQKMNELKPEQREILLLKLVEGYTDEEIANELQLKLGTVKSRIHRAKESLKSILKKGGVLHEDE